MKVLVCGGRDYNDWQRLHSTLLDLHRARPFTHVIHGDYRGADHMADRFALMYALQPVRCPANWNLLKKAAGPRRNRAMLGLVPDLVVAFPGGTGTADMASAAEEMGIEVKRVTE
jgi:hypothetical protein